MAVIPMLFLPLCGWHCTCRFSVTAKCSICGIQAGSILRTYSKIGPLPTFRLLWMQDLAHMVTFAFFAQALNVRVLTAYVCPMGLLAPFARLQHVQQLVALSVPG